MQEKNVEDLLEQAEESNLAPPTPVLNEQVIMLYGLCAVDQQLPAGTEPSRVSYTNIAADTVARWVMQTVAVKRTQSTFGSTIICELLFRLFLILHNLLDGVQVKI